MTSWLGQWFGRNSHLFALSARDIASSSVIPSNFSKADAVLEDGVMVLGNNGDGGKRMNAWIGDEISLDSSRWSAGRTRQLGPRNPVRTCRHKGSLPVSTELTTLCSYCVFPLSRTAKSE